MKAPAEHLVLEDKEFEGPRRDGIVARSRQRYALVWWQRRVVAVLVEVVACF